MLVALQMHRLLYTVLMEGRETPMIFSVVLTIRCRVLWSKTVQFPDQTLRQLVRTLSV